MAREYDSDLDPDEFEVGIEAKVDAAFEKAAKRVDELVKNPECCCQACDDAREAAQDIRAMKGK